MSTFHVAPNSTPAPVLNPAGYPVRKQHAGKTDAQVRAEGHKLLAQAEKDRAELTRLQADQQAIADEIYNHPLNVLARRLASAKQAVEHQEAIAEASQRRGRSAIVTHADPAIDRCKTAVIAKMDMTRAKSAPTKRTSDYLAACLEALNAIEALVLADYGASAEKQLKKIMSQISLEVPPAPAEVKAINARFSSIDPDNHGE